jgi:hypothetical protein
MIAGLPPTLAAILGYVANSRSIRRSVGAPPGVPLAKIVERVEEKIDGLTEGQSEMRERLARLEGARELRFWRPS